MREVAWDNSRKGEEEAKSICKALIEDRQLNFLETKRKEIYLYSRPIVYIKDGKEKIVWEDEINNPRLKEIERLIEGRTNQIKSFYEG